MATIPEIVDHLEADDALHLGRILLLIGTFAGQGGRERIEGLTKLAKLDFLLRYPAYLERILEVRGISAGSVDTQDFERTSVEAKMVRYRFGPWDYRYRRFLNTLTAKGLTRVETIGRTVKIGITQAGSDASKTLAELPEFTSFRSRATLLRRHLNLSASNLVELVYNTFPELSSMRMGETIE